MPRGAIDAPRDRAATIVHLIILAAISLVYGAIGAACMTWPHAIQRHMLRQCERAPRRFPLLIRLVGSPRYALYLQAIGALCSTAALGTALILLFLMRHRP